MAETLKQYVQCIRHYVIDYIEKSYIKGKNLTGHKGRIVAELYLWKKSLIAACFFPQNFLRIHRILL